MILVQCQSQILFELRESNLRPGGHPNAKLTDPPQCLRTEQNFITYWENGICSKGAMKCVRCANNVLPTRFTFCQLSRDGLLPITFSDCEDVLAVLMLNTALAWQGLVSSL